MFYLLVSRYPFLPCLSICLHELCLKSSSIARRLLHLAPKLTTYELLLRVGAKLFAILTDLPGLSSCPANSSLSGTATKLLEPPISLQPTTLYRPQHTELVRTACDARAAGAQRPE